MPLSASAASKVDFSNDNCKKVTGLSRDAEAEVSRQLNVSIRSIYLHFSIGALSIGGNDTECKVGIDTPKGVKTIYIGKHNGQIWTDRNLYWIHWAGW